MASGKKVHKKQGNVAIVLLLIIGAVLAVFLVGKQTNWFNHAAGPADQAITNLNSATEILSTVNANGTMGPQSSYGNWSNALPSFLKGKLVFAVTDPVQGGKPDDPGSQGQAHRPSTVPTHALPTQAQGSQAASEQDNGPQTVTALNVTITKVEVHIAYQGDPGDHATNAPEGGKPSVSPSQRGQNVDHWETLAITAPVTVDLVALAKTNDFSTLGITTLAAGRYTEVRLYLSAATATLENGTTQALKILGRDNIVRVVKPFTITAGQSTKLTMDFDAQHSVIKAGDIYLLRPIVARLLEDH